MRKLSHNIQVTQLMSDRARIWNGAVCIHVIFSLWPFSNIKSCLPLLLWHPTPPPRLWRFSVFCTPWHSPLWIGSALIFDEMYVAAFLLLHQDPSAGSPDQPALCLSRRSWDPKWESFQVWMYLFLKMKFYCLKEIIWICLVFYALLKKYIV